MTMRITWKRYAQLVRAEHVMLIDGAVNGVWISAAQHPTALRPYIAHEPNGEPIGQNWHYLADAQAEAEAWFKENDWATPEAWRRLKPFTPGDSK